MLKRLDEAHLESFLGYCRAHRNELDESYLSDAELEKFRIEPANPAFINLDEDMRITGAISLVINEAALRARRARLRILHSETGDPDIYRSLMEALQKESPGIDSFYVFSPDANSSLLGNLKRLGFAVERFVFLLIREDETLPKLNLPSGFSLRQYVAGSDEQAWCNIRNCAFASLKGNESPIAVDMVREMAAGEDSVAGGMLFLADGERPVGLIRGSDDEYEGRTVMNIGPLAVLPTYQGKGLGRVLLRAILSFAHEKSYGRALLSVNADNESALSLYTQEGFKKAEGFACLGLAAQNP